MVVVAFGCFLLLLHATGRSMCVLCSGGVRLCVRVSERARAAAKENEKRERVNVCACVRVCVCVYLDDTDADLSDAAMRRA